MKRSFVFVLVVFAALILQSCSKNQTETSSEPSARRATVTLKEGTTMSGNVVSSSDKEITLAGDDKITRTIPMDQVRSIAYSDPETAAEVADSSAEPSPTDQAQAERSSQAPPPVKTLQPATAVNSQAAPLKPTYEVPAGTRIAVRTFDTIDSATAAEGQTFAGEVTKNVVDAGGHTVIPARSSTEIVIKSASKGGHFRGTSDLVLDLKSVTIGGKRYGVETAVVSKEGKQGMGANKRTATYTGGGAALGAIIGAIAGGGKGAAIGAASGAGAGAVTQAITKGGSIKIPAETILTFQLDKPLTVMAEK